ncbi:MAG: hypothetical protein WCP09_02160 [Candidatus Taylorbacteria bacterium]
MKNGKRHNKRKWFSSSILFFGVLIVFIVLARAAFSIYGKAQVSDVKLDQARSELIRLQERQADLSDQVSRLSTDEGVEAEIRTKYKGVRSGESVAVIIGDDVLSTSSASSTVAPTAAVGWFAQLLQKFGL